MRLITPSTARPQTPLNASWRANLGRWSRAGLALAGLALVTGCDLNFWRMDGHQSTIEVNGPVALDQLHVFYVTCWVTFILFILVGTALAYATLKFRARGGDGMQEPPEQSHGNPLVELSLIGASVLALVIIAVPTLKAIWFTYDVPEAEKANAYHIRADGYQWWWRFEYTDEKIKDVGELVTANELVIPADRPIRIELRGMDVIHSFWVPKLAGKVDMIPNRANFLWLKADKPGYYWGQCAEYCGDSHAVMRFRVIALGPREFNEWLDQQMQPARSVAPIAKDSDLDKLKPQFASFKIPAERNAPGWSEKFDLNPLDAWRAHQFPDKGENAELIAKGRKLFQEKTCVTCHTVRGQEGIGTTAPDLTHVGSRTTIAAGVLENNPDNLARWITHPEEVKPGNHMYLGIGAMKGFVTVDRETGAVTRNITVSDDEAHALVAYLESLK
ncbi:MAG TPA: cytochrome c oxidase subunit II [Opitutus sp.]|nr:cytochrome c oxidase subunit II [Opitutus sp.]